jgi:hypothetical protein
MGRVPGGAEPVGWWSWTSEPVELGQPACRVSVLSQHVVRVACRGDVTCVTYVVGVDVRTVT